MENNFINQSYQVYKTLTEKYGENIRMDDILALSGRLVGKYKGRSFSISFSKDNYLIISIANDGKNLLEELKPTLNMIMDGKQPICYYELENEILDKAYAMPTLEWNTNPNDRLKLIMNGIAFNYNTKIHNFTLYDNTHVESINKVKEIKKINK